MSDDLALALALADDADALTLPAFDRGATASEKADGTPVTETDGAVERVLRERLAADRPDDGVLGEELGAAGSGARRWVLDPLDGTEWFARGIPVWGTLTAVEDAFVAHANLHLGFEIDAGPLLRAARLSGGWESFLGLMLCADGAVDAAFAPRAFLWDLLPAQLIVEEAGGRFTDFDGHRTAAGRGAVAANPALHADVLARLQTSASSAAATAIAAGAVGALRCAMPGR